MGTVAVAGSLSRGDAPPRRWRLGVAGCGAFAAFAVAAAAALPEVELAAVADPEEERRRALARAWQEERARRGLPAPAPAPFADHESLLEAGTVDLVWVLTPPFLHHPVARAALEAGCHVFLEKPGGLTLSQMDELAALAAARRLAVGVDFVMRHNPVYRFLHAAARAGAFGPPERAALENHARGDHLPPGHWFWDEEKSGGIWVEHGVHFFDLLTWLLGPPASLVSLGGGRDAVAAVVLHPLPGGPALAGHYHGFTRPAVAERTTLSLVYQRAHVLVEGWVAVRLRADVLLGDEGEEALARLAPSFPWLRAADAEESRPARENLSGTELLARGIPLRVKRRVTLTGDLGDRQELYRECIRAGLADLVRAAADPGHRPVVRLEDAREALRVALAARRSQQSGVRVDLRR